MTAAWAPNGFAKDGEGWVDAGWFRDERAGHNGDQLLQCDATVLWVLITINQGFFFLGVDCASGLDF